MPTQVGGDAVTHGSPNPGADLLDSRHQRIGEQHGPADTETKLGTGLAVRSNTRGIVIGGAGDETWPQRLVDAQCKALGLTAVVLGV